MLILVSNQPSFAKGKTSMEQLHAIHARLEQALKAAGVVFEEFNYCFHHPASIVAELKGPCQCRKPSPYFLNRAVERLGLERRDCWMVGDQDTDTECGRQAGVKTVLIENPGSVSRQRKSAPDFTAPDLAGAAEIILSKG
jgi:D-glycero-D-manno-heptose 1,7-bisphosphate phosphatase